MKTVKHDLVVLGGGPAGYVASLRAAQLGLAAACVDDHPLLGGTCLRVGCIPSKALLESTAKLAEVQHDLSAHGIHVEDPRFDLAAMLRRKEEIVGSLARGVEGLFKKQNIARYQGRGKLDGAGRVRVEGHDGETLIEARWILIATGSQPASLPGVQVDGDRIGTSSEALAYSQVPEHLVVIGAGYIGIELGSVWNRLGAKVTVLESLERILPGLDAEIAEQARPIYEKQGLTFKLGMHVVRAFVDGQQAVVECEGTAPIRCDRVLLAVGRVPYTAGLGLENAGIQCDQRGRILVNSAWETAAENVYAVGDCIAGPMLAHKASDEATACVERIATGYGHVNYDAIPAVVYTHPEIAAVGQTEDELRSSGREYKKGTFPFRANGRARTLGETQGMVKVLADARTDRLLGVHILGPRAGDLIAEAVVSLDFGASSEDIARSVHAHPTLSEAFHEAALDVGHRALHAP
jgi:dihydrolipoamide dehydrogenase